MFETRLIFPKKWIEMPEAGLSLLDLKFEACLVTWLVAVVAGG
jgi:hypothetical protein